MMVTPTFYVLTPDDTTPAGIEYARRWFQRCHRPVAGVWSVESGEFKPGFHLNIIADMADISRPFKGHVYAEPIRSTVRAVAAYITKAQRAASKAEGFARQTGDLGPASNWLRKATFDAPVVAGAQALHEVAPGFLPPSAPGPEQPEDTTLRWLDPVYQAATIELDPSFQGEDAREGEPPKQETTRQMMLRFRLAQRKKRQGTPSVYRWPQPAPIVRTPHTTNPDNARLWIGVLRAVLAGEAPPPAGPAPPEEPPD